MKHREPKHFLWSVKGKVGTVTLNRPERKNPLTFESYGELRDFFRDLALDTSIKSIVIHGAGDNFCSGGDVHEIIGPLVSMEMPELLAFTRMTGDLIKAIRSCPQPVIAAVDGICVGAGAAIAMAADLRFGTERTKVAFLFSKVGLAGCDMGACAFLPRIIGQGRAAELLFTGRVMKGDEGLEWGFFNRLCNISEVYSDAVQFGEELASGPTFAHSMTKRMLDHEWTMGITEALESEAQAQAICMQTNDFERAYKAFVEKGSPAFKGN